MYTVIFYNYYISDQTAHAQVHKYTHCIYIHTIQRYSIFLNYCRASLSMSELHINRENCFNDES